MTPELKDILESGLRIIYDGEGYLKRWEWRETLEQRLENYFNQKVSESK